MFLHTPIPRLQKLMTISYAHLESKLLRYVGKSIHTFSEFFESRHACDYFRMFTVLIWALLKLFQAGCSTDGGEDQNHDNTLVREARKRNKSQLTNLNQQNNLYADLPNYMALLFLVSVFHFLSNLNSPQNASSLEGLLMPAIILTCILFHGKDGPQNQEMG